MTSTSIKAEVVKHKKVNPEIDKKYQRGIPAIRPRAVELKFTPKVNTMPKTKMHIVHTQRSMKKGANLRIGRI